MQLDQKKGLIQVRGLKEFLRLQDQTNILKRTSRKIKNEPRQEAAAF